MSATHEFDRKYIRSISGLCKLSCLLCSCIGLLCIVCSSVRTSNFRGSCYLVVAITGFFITLTLFLVQSLGLSQRLPCRCDQQLWTLCTHTVLAISYFAASGLVLSLNVGGYTAAAFFGLMVFTINALEAYVSYRRGRQRDVATQTHPQLV